ncbi:TldD protein [Litorimonas taeanensis]|uniref:TldD protein n=1 Tax=Litorimonas taeanensis TaxID=568099 RepID=A0A420WE22_9PROT|nr:metalloprotease TldD [Litorimonas taeanensis]RKQ69274.1 TldD protein [Litorimonas taeanensis]
MSDFVFEDSELSAEQAQLILNNTLKGADDGELFVERSASESLTFDDGRLKTASFDTSRGFGLRCVAGDTSGFAQGTEMSTGALTRASQAVIMAKQGYDGTAAEAPSRNNRRLYPDIDPITHPGFGVKVELLEEIDAYCRALDPSVVQVTATLSATRRNIAILRAGGERYNDIRPLVRLNIAIVAEMNGRREQGYAGAGGRKAYDGYIDPQFWKPLAKEALRQAIVNLDSVPAPAGQMDVVLGPGWPGVLLHEAMGHGLEGDFIRKGTSAFSNMLGQRVAAPGVTVVDNGTLEGRRGSLSIDDEGTPTSNTVLIEDGILKGFMQDRLNARLMGVAATGNGRRESFAHAPMPRMTNTYMLGGDKDPKEMLADLKDGIYATNFGGGQVDITSGKFVFQCTEAYRVRNGEVGEALKGVTLIGDGPSVLTQIRHVGNDMELDPGIGVCGKAGQGVPVGVGQPSLYVENLTVGGSAA